MIVYRFGKKLRGYYWRKRYYPHIIWADGKRHRASRRPPIPVSCNPRPHVRASRAELAGLGPYTPPEKRPCRRLRVWGLTGSWWWEYRDDRGGRVFQFQLDRHFAGYDASRGGWQ